MNKSYLENYLKAFTYDNLGAWCLPGLSSFSDKKTLFYYQEKALCNFAKLLKLYYTEADGKQCLYQKCIEQGMGQGSFKVEEFGCPLDQKKGITNPRFQLLATYFPVVNCVNQYIKGSNFFNRMAFWMATGSGKSIVLIKAIEYLYYLQGKNLIPKKEIMLLLPRADLINQFKRELKEYNLYREIPIELINLKHYAEEKQALTLLKSYKVYYYRSDLIRDQRKENILDFKDYDNNGNWYLFLDEAHRGEMGVSQMQDYISILTRNGFLFNFSATFADAIDYATTVYNFNLEKFINAGYGKNIYLSSSYFDFNHNQLEFSKREKQKQVLKSLIILAIIKQAKRNDWYHQPLLITLVNSINTDDSDLLMFFEQLEAIAQGAVEEQLFLETKTALIRDCSVRTYVFGDGQLPLAIDLINNLMIKDLLRIVFNAKTHGAIEILEGEKGKELVLKLQTTTVPFGLIKIGEADKFQKERLGLNYTVISGYETRNYFRGLNQNHDLNLLLGSRSFYEGWDSNRPNVINFINIGGKAAKKYVLQAIGRGVRIEPQPGYRQRLSENDQNKNHLLETLFIFATDKKGVRSILETLDEQKHIQAQTIALDVTKVKPFDLLIPKFKETSKRYDFASYYVSKVNKENFKKYFNYYDENLLLLKTGMKVESYDFLKQQINVGQFMSIDETKHYDNYENLLMNIITHIVYKNMIVDKMQALADEIVHFKHIKVMGLSQTEMQTLKEKVKKVSKYEKINKKELALAFAKGYIKENEFDLRIETKAEETFKELKIIKLVEHYYLPLIYSQVEKVEYIRNIINVESEVKFLINLINYMGANEIKVKWMFSKIDEKQDNIYIPYYLKQENRYSKFFPDFIFWLKRGNHYKIVFVDPKGTTNVDYINKIDEFERIFYEGGKPKVYQYQDYMVTFDLKMVTSDINKIPSKYVKFWLSRGDFSFISI